MKSIVSTLVLALIFACSPASKLSKPTEKFEVIAYYAGDGNDLHRYRFEQLTQIIFSFCHLRGNRLAVDNAQDSLTIRKLTDLKKQHPRLKVLLSLGGWCGCEPCSDIFSSEKARAEFAQSTLELLRFFNADGLDLDWEYPAIEGCPGHPFKPADKPNFTALVAELRRVWGKKYVLSFAAGGFGSFLEKSVEWEKVMPLLDNVNLMSYDLVSGFSKKTGHHTALFSSPQQSVSTDEGVKNLVARGVPRSKIIIGAAFYARIWEEVADVNQGIFQQGKFKASVHYHDFPEWLPAEKGFVFYRDETAQAPYAYSPQLRQFATFDDPVSLARKTKYARDERLGGIMFWQLTGDSDDGALLRAIHETKGSMR